MTKLGFIGLGNMGFHMARRLLEQGHSVALLDTRKEALEPFQAYPNATIAATPAEVTQFADTILVSLPNPQVAKIVAFGENGLTSGRAFKTYIDLSTTGPEASQQIATALGERGVACLDAPVSGGVPGAEQGTLSIMVAGPKEAYDENHDILGIIGNKIFYVGAKAGQAQTLKIANNYLSAVALIATSEAMVLGVKAGLDPQIMLDVLNVSSGRNSASLDKFPAAVLNRKFDYGFKSGLMYKDVALCMQEADRLGATMWIGSNVKEFFKLTKEHLGADSDTTEVVRLFEDWAKVQVGASEE
ncbi:NAD(P)-dependent oxidoreductase [Brevibacillus fulvus]|uniref:3-hydroxyisobutyrate dehydrogenase-like beta-hydroxyacid dehydrogenase n=1 Tax=Brevibacillus fulvus TaxID=1125967 RepID=A0A939BTV9_9BACL|nr:NAD(P)-dependent oxidoreductase [Brevibacillus fulvus]MBM7588871.1 3-hydroxyisobutyrate dehydrogenase-like beta-hydroxyacid dehydrogenase [Brevibacillus fulvus]